MKIQKPTLSGNCVTVLISANGIDWQFQHTRSTDHDALNLFRVISDRWDEIQQYDREALHNRLRCMARVENSNRQLRAYIRRLKAQIGGAA